MPYSERVHSPRWLALATLTVAVAVCGWGLWLLLVTGEAGPGLILNAAGATLAVVGATDGRRYYVSSASPDDLAAAIGRLSDRARSA